MRALSKKKMKELQKEVEKEFPESYGLQQVHLARLIIEEKTKGLQGKALIDYFRNIAREYEEANHGR